MKSVNISDLDVGSTSRNEFYSRNGDLLISQGITITQNHIDILKRRNVFELFVKESKDDDEIQRLLFSDFQKLDDLDIRDTAKKDPPTFAPLPKALELPEFKDIDNGQAGFEQLNKSEKAEELDKAWKSGKTPDQPCGPALKDEAAEMDITDRNVEYKNKVVSGYNLALNDVRTILRAIADGQNVDGGSVRSIVDRFVNTFITDKNILLNISLTKSPSSEYIYHHTLNVCLLSINIAASSSYSKEQVVEIGMGALLHDVGMLLVPEQIMKKQGRLTEGEWYEIQKHPVMGLHLLERVGRLPASVPFVAYQTHERENGRGYPKKRTTRLIHNFAKIVQIADTFEALSSPRPYRNPHLPYKAMEMIIKMTRQGLISGAFVKSFLSYTSLFPVGSLVELSDKRLAKVVKANGTSFSKPLVSVLSDPKGQPLSEENIHQEDLSRNTELQIVRALQVDSLPSVSIMHGF